MSTSEKETKWKEHGTRPPVAQFSSGHSVSKAHAQQPTWVKGTCAAVGMLWNARAQLWACAGTSLWDDWLLRQEWRFSCQGHRALTSLGQPWSRKRPQVWFFPPPNHSYAFRYFVDRHAKCNLHGEHVSKTWPWQKRILIPCLHVYFVESLPSASRICVMHTRYLLTSIN